MDVGPAQLSTAALATRYATAGSDDWVETLSRADANGVAIPVLEGLFAGTNEPIDVESAHAWRDSVAGTSGAPSTASADAPDVPATRYLAAELRRRRSRLDQFGLDLAFVDDLLAGHDLPYAVIKTNVDPAYRPWDLNVLVDEADWPQVQDLLTDHGWERTSLRAHPLARSEPGKRLYEHEFRHPVHLHRAVSWNGLTYLPAETVLDSRIRVDGIAYPDPITDAVIHCAHSVFENFELGLVEAVEIVRVLGDETGRDQEQGRRLAIDNGWPAGFDLALTTAYDVVEGVKRAPEAVTVPQAYPTFPLVRAWLQHARRTDGGWYELPLNVAIKAIK